MRVSEGYASCQREKRRKPSTGKGMAKQRSRTGDVTNGLRHFITIILCFGIKKKSRCTASSYIMAKAVVQCLFSPQVVRHESQ
jgi:hypothetical protein